MKNPTRLAVLVAFAALGLGIIAAAAVLITGSPPQITATGGDIGGAFSLIDQKGRAVSDASLKGKPSIVFFGFTHCPEVCPTTLAEMSTVLDLLGGDADNVNTVFVSVDPECDTREMLGEYLTAFDPRIIGLTGTIEEINAVAKAYRVYFKKVALEGGDYTVDHTALVYLMDKEGKFVAPLPIAAGPEKAVDSIRKLL